MITWKLRAGWRRWVASFARSYRMAWGRKEKPPLSKLRPLKGDDFERALI
jgi:hypothetical protein